MINSSEYKIYHETYMQNNLGTTAFHTFLCTFLTVQCSIYISIQNTIPTSRQYVKEYIIIVLPMILAHTVLADHIIVLNIILFFILLYNCLFHRRNAIKKFGVKNIYKSDRTPIISFIRGLPYLITVLCILAVDFRDFPRNLAKTEKFGYSLMDTGVGFFVIVSGLVHKDARKYSIMYIIKSNVKIIGILLLLGVGRFVSVKQLDYQEHITEYGVHWNFFFTIAICKILSTIILYLSNQVLLLSIILLVFHEFVLYIGVQEWVLSDIPRDTLISANREGMSSTLGYVSMYLFGVCIRYVLLNKNVTKFETLKRLVLGTILLWVFTLTLDLVLPTSRTLANASFCIFMNAIIVTSITVIYFVTTLCEEKDNILVPLILSTINSNGLSYFLIGNLFTGAINLSMRTLFVSSGVTFVILNIYMILTLVAIVYLRKLGITI